MTEWEFRRIGPIAFPDLKTALDIRAGYPGSPKSTCLVLPFDEAEEFVVGLLRALPPEVRVAVVGRLAEATKAGVQP